MLRCATLAEVSSDARIDYFEVDLRAAGARRYEPRHGKARAIIEDDSVWPHWSVRASDCEHVSIPIHEDGLIVAAPIEDVSLMMDSGSASTLRSALW